MKPINFFLGLLFVLLAQGVNATPVANNPSGPRGGSVHVLLSEPNPDGLDALQLDITYTPAHLEFIGNTAGDMDLLTLTILYSDDQGDDFYYLYDAISGPLGLFDSLSNQPYTKPVSDLASKAKGKISVVLAAAGVTFDCVTDPKPVGSVCQNDVSILDMVFKILDAAPFGTPNSGGTSVFFSCYDDGTQCDSSYSAFQAVQSDITVLRSTQIPLPATLWLLALGMTALAGVRLRR